MKELLITVALIALAGSSMAHDAMKVVTADELVWKDEPVLAKSGQTAILVGDASKAETIVLRVKFPPITKFRRTLILFRKSSLRLAAFVGTGWVFIPSFARTYLIADRIYPIGHS